MDNKELHYTISKPPINILFNPSLISKNRKGIWSINIASLLELFINILEERKNKDLRLCGIAILSSSIIFRIKVESIFMLERIAERSKQRMDEKGEEDLKAIVKNISMLEMPYRHEATYDVTLEELLEILSSIVERISKAESKQVIEPIEYDDTHLIDLESVINEYKERLYNAIIDSGVILFNNFVKYLDPVDTARYFIAMLHLCMEDRISIEQVDDYNIELKLSN